MPFISQRRSMIEALTNTIIQFIITPIIWLVIVIPVLGIDPPIAISVLLIIILSTASTLRMYLVRRYFNRRYK